MGIPKQKWTSDEEDALLAGVAKHGAGKWRHILSDPDFAPTLAHRSNVDLKDKWRNMYAQRTYERPNNPKTKNSVRGTLPLLSIPNTVTPEAVVVENQERYTTLIFEALSGVSAMKDPSGSDVGAIRDYIQLFFVRGIVGALVTEIFPVLLDWVVSLEILVFSNNKQKNGKPIPQNFKKLLGARLRSLVKLGKLEKTQNGFKIKRVTPSSVKAPSWLKTSTEIDEEDVRNAAYTVAEAENKSFLADEAVKETERISRIAEDAESLLLAVEEINEQCSRGEVFHLS